MSVEYWKDIIKHDPTRRTGRTTREIDKMVQEIFTKGFTISKWSSHGEIEDKRVFNILRRRLDMEHSHAFGNMICDNLLFVIYYNKKAKDLFEHDVRKALRK